MGTIVILAILVVILVAAVKSSRKHFHGEGGCCGGSAQKVEDKKLDGIQTSKKIIHMKGMHCENCKRKVEQAINEIDGALADVDLKNNSAIVTMDRVIQDDELKAAIERLEFKVISIETM